MTFAVFGALSAFFAVAAGAFGAHALRGAITPDLLLVFETAARYQLYHALALIAVDLVRAHHAGAPRRALGTAGVLFVAGTVLFSGSLYTLALTGGRAWGAVTPFGGVAFLGGWVAFALGCRGTRASR